MKNVLRHFMQTYFHQDWKDEFQSIDDAAHQIVSGNPAQIVAELMQELKEFLADHPSDSQAADGLEELHSDYVPPNSHEWLLQFSEALCSEYENAMKGGGGN